MIKVVNQNVEVWKQNGYDLESIYDHVARCARVCYQSTPKNKDESSYDFLKRTILRGKDIEGITVEDIPKLHLSVFEHGTVHLRIPADIVFDYSFTKVVFNKTKIYTEKDGKVYYYITTNMRAIIENDYIFFSNYIDTDNSHAYMYPTRITLNLTTDIGCSRELNRHRCHSISEESTRYCRYTADKFGGNITIAKLPWINYSPKKELVDTAYENGFYNDNEIYDEKTHLIEARRTNRWNAIDWFLYGVQISNLIYNKCVQLGWTAQQAREILPLNTKTQLVHTAFVTDWDKFINLRCNEVSGKVHPMMKELALKIKDAIDNEYK